VGGALLDDGHAVADPFHPTGELAFLLAERARQLSSASAPAAPSLARPPGRVTRDRKRRAPEPVGRPPARVQQARSLPPASAQR
jgi:hypothetical protein